MRIIGWLVLVLVFFSSCNSEGVENMSADKVVAEITQMEKELSQNPDVKEHQKKARALLKFYRGFVDNNPQHEQSPEYLFKAAEVAMGLEKPEEAIRLLKRLNKHYKKFKKAPEALFLTAFIYDNQLNQKGEAEMHYKKVISQFPRHELAIEARSSIKLLHMSDEEIMKMFEEKNRDTTAVQ